MIVSSVAISLINLDEMVCVEKTVYCNAFMNAAFLVYLEVNLIFCCSLFRNRGLGIGIARACGVKCELPNGYLEDKTCIRKPHVSFSNGSTSFKRFYFQENGFPRLPSANCFFSSQAGAESSGTEDELEDGFSELETPLGSNAATESNLDDEKADGLGSEAEASDVDDDEESPENELDITEKGKEPSGRAQSELFKAIIAARSVENALDRWVEDGKDLNRGEIWLATYNLRRRRMFGRALQVILSLIYGSLGFSSSYCHNSLLLIDLKLLVCLLYI